MADGLITIIGYEIREQIYNGSRTLVYRGQRLSDNQPVAIKILKNYPTAVEVAQFQNQYVIAKNLDFTGIVRVYSLETYQTSYALIMEFGGVPLNYYIHHYIDIFNNVLLCEFLEIAIQIVDILAELSKNRVIHKDIKPANILINPETNRVKIIDFSISSLLPRETQQLQNINGLEGTLAYISPE